MGTAQADTLQSPIVIRIEMTEFAFTPSVIHIEKGRLVQLLLVNQGEIAHQLETTYFRREEVRVTAEAMHLEAPGLNVVRLQPGTRAKLEFLPRRSGRYAFACTIEGHQEAGMKGLLVVR